MANQKIFCNTPWYEAHIYWDGSLGICCQENRKLHSDNQKYNIKNMSLSEWFNSEHVRAFRKSLLADTPTDICNRCYHEENLGGNSRRHRSNQKSVIFTRTGFHESFLQSPGYPHFKLSEDTDGVTDTLPIDLHVDLGNYCNLACKMCRSDASSTFASQMVKWGNEDHRQYLGTDWTKDSITWNKFLNELLTIPKLQNIHFMGGETLLTARFEEFVDFMILHKRFDICFSFVTNGTSFNESLLSKLKLFSRVGIEVSIETTTAHNNYVRQGTDTAKVLTNIQRYKDLCNNSTISVTIRPAVSALTIGYYYTLLEYCLEHKLLIKSNLVTNPGYLSAVRLPADIRASYIDNYERILSSIPANIDIMKDYNESDPHNYVNSIKIQTIQTLNMLKVKGQQEELSELIQHCRRWDDVYKLDARTLYPEFKELFDRHGY
jgi:sulfatase maturation enzyme AslB (radical SAM superfamily)